MLCLFGFVNKMFCSIAREDEAKMSFIVAVVYSSGIGAGEPALAAEEGAWTASLFHYFSSLN